MRTLSSVFFTAAVAATLALTACAAPSVVEPADQSAPLAPSQEETQPPAAQQSPQDAYLAWLAASRQPDAKLACSMMSDALIERMLAEMSESLGATFGSCEEMITVTAAAYAAVGSSAEVEVTVVSESENEATLFSRYVDSGKCGTIVLERSADTWVMNEQSEECVAG